MPICFQLIERKTGKPCPLTLVDDKLCDELGVKPDLIKYLDGWYNIIGFPLALGHSFKEIRDSWGQYEPSRLDQILNILERDYYPNSFRSAY